MVTFYNDDTYGLSLTAENELLMTEETAVYKSFLIRIWGNEANQQRRIMVARIGAANEPAYFTTLDDLMIFLLQEIETPSKGETPMV